MKKIAIITDSSSDIPDYILDKYNIFVLPLRIIYKDKEYEDRIDISPDEVYNRLEDEVPKTSLPSVARVKEYVEQIISEGYSDILGLFISARLSGTFSMVKQVLEDEKRVNIQLYDTKSLSLGLGFIVIEAAKAIRKGAELFQIDTLINDYIKCTKCYYVIKTLEFLKKGGRIGRVEGTIGEILNVKPIISINEEGVYYTYKKVRGRKRSIGELVDIVKSYAPKPIRVALMHGNALEELKYVQDHLEKMSHVKEFLIEQISPVLTVHTGPGLVGVVCQEI